jgi:hypothetical protein
VHIAVEMAPIAKVGEVQVPAAMLLLPVGVCSIDATSSCFLLMKLPAYRIESF